MRSTDNLYAAHGNTQLFQAREQQAFEHYIKARSKLEHQSLE